MADSKPSKTKEEWTIVEPNKGNVKDGATCTMKSQLLKIKGRTFLSCQAKVRLTHHGILDFFKKEGVAKTETSNDELLEEIVCRRYGQFWKLSLINSKTVTTLAELVNASMLKGIGIIREDQVVAQLQQELIGVKQNIKVNVPPIDPMATTSSNVSVTYPGPFKCPWCDCTMKRPGKLSEHCEEEHGVNDLRFACALCNRVGTLFSTSVHYDRCKTARERAKEQAPVNGIVSCIAEGCCRTFTTFTGLRLHTKRAHPAMFEATKKPIYNKRWDDEERILLAKLQIEFSGRGVSERMLSELLAEELHAAGGKLRSSESVKGQIRKPEQRKLVAEMRKCSTGTVTQNQSDKKARK